MLRLVNCSMSNKPNVLRHPLFLFCLLLLVLNDHVLKQAYHNSITGKLSDFAGLFIFPIFWSYYLPKYKKVIYVFTALFFIYFKSSLSAPLLNLFEQLNIPITRVVDYTDLYALLILPFSYWFLNNAKPLQFKLIGTWAVSIISLFAFCATSVIPKYIPKNVQYYDRREHKTKLTRQEVLHSLDSLNIDYVVDAECWRPRYFLNDSTHTHDSNCFHREYWTLHNLPKSDDALESVFMGFDNDRIIVYGIKLKDSIPKITSYEKQNKVLRRYRKKVIKPLIKQIK